MRRIIGQINHFVNYRTLLDIVFKFGVMLSILFFWPKNPIIYEIPKVWIVNRWIEVMGLLFLVFGLKYLKREKLDSFLIIITILFLVTAFLTSLAGLDFGKSIYGNYYRNDGLITLSHLIILFLIITLNSYRGWLKGLIKISAYSSVVLSLLNILSFVLVNSYGKQVTNWDDAYGATFGNPNFLSGYLIVTLPFTVYFFDKEKNIILKYIWFVFFLMQIYGILLTKTWAGYFGITLFIVIWLFMKLKGKYRILALTCGGLLFLFMGTVFINYQRSLSSPTSINPESRNRIMMKGILALRERPVFGYGWANFDYAFSKIDYPIHMDEDVYVDKAHSSVLEVLVATGIIGFAVYLLIIARVLLNLWKRKSFLEYKYLLFAFVLVILHMQTNVISISEELMFWLIAGFSAKKFSSKLRLKD